MKGCLSLKRNFIVLTKGSPSFLWKIYFPTRLKKKKIHLVIYFLDYLSTYIYSHAVGTENLGLEMVSEHKQTKNNQLRVSGNL